MDAFLPLVFVFTVKIGVFDDAFFGFQLPLFVVVVQVPDHQKRDRDVVQDKKEEGYCLGQDRNGVEEVGGRVVGRGNEVLDAHVVKYSRNVPSVKGNWRENPNAYRRKWKNEKGNLKGSTNGAKADIVVVPNDQEAADEMVFEANQLVSLGPVVPKHDGAVHED